MCMATSKSIFTQIDGWDEMNTISSVIFRLKQFKKLCEYE
jgi:hypothetical protein